MGEKRRRGGEPDGAGAPEDATPARGAAEGDLDDDASIGNSIQMLGKYTLLDTLGRGAAGIVYHAHLAGPMGFRKQVALKTIPSRSTEQEAQIRALINEARLGGHLEHPNIVSILDFGEVEGTFYIAMEYVQGHTLRDVLRQVRRRGPMPPAMIAGIGVQICRGLSYAHNATDDKGQPLSMIHRDLKPANVMITRQALIKVMDFGVAKWPLAEVSTTAGIIKGTPLYMAPEQVRAKPVTPASDIFSLGTVLYQLLTNRPLFQADTVRELLRQVALAEVEDQLDRIPADCRPLKPVLREALQRDPADRFASAGEFLAALDNARQKVRDDGDLRTLVRAIFGAGRAPEKTPPPPKPSTVERVDGGDWSVRIDRDKVMADYEGRRLIEKQRPDSRRNS